MLARFLKLTWIEIKIFVREPLGLIFSVGMPVGMFIFFGRSVGARDGASERLGAVLGQTIPIFIAMFIALSSALSLIAVISIYREGGILKRLRATPLGPPTILLAHVAVKLIFTALTLGLMVLAGRRFYPVPLEFDVLNFGLALLFSTVSVISIGFVIASAVPTARFAQPIGSAILYPMLAISGIFAPIEALPKFWATIAGVLPVTHAVALMKGMWIGGSWLDHLPNVGVLALTIVICTAVSARIFRWE
jgi:ABC-2 type transport system permease protein